MAKIGTFINLAYGQVNKGIYVWNCDGELLKDINQNFIKMKESGAKSSKKTEEARKKEKAEWLADALAMYEKRKNIQGARAFDCSGLVGWALRECGVTKADKTAEGWREQCTKVTKSSLQDGDLCFKVSDGKAHHVGIYYKGKIIESKGRAYGVVYSSLTSSWDAFGRLNIKWENEPTKWVLTRVLRKGDNDKKQGGHDVENMQKLLIANGEKLKKYGADGDFGTETLNAVRSFQRKHEGKPYYLKVDGAVGKNTIIALGGEWGGK